jgi:hypothetical protein
MDKIVIVGRCSGKPFFEYKKILKKVKKEKSKKSPLNKK